ncbi:hypothetical protein MIND_00881900 [Mycena indigotica]|uniref:Uncharacterized protein n=1 Tax=Mycena indigotica TaxID=2126181 RepID=A0A8H6VZC6_9AGAR|nr:uncharacterized protein MIND_00881900 [Mycena indigotica]KAF7299327.1 hypothetical protein MIND_00881900 [Mycena indigotica]
MSPHHSLRHFKKGISLTTQWTGKEHKEMEKVFLGLTANATDPRVLRAVRGLLDFTYYAHFRVHSDESLSLMDTAWSNFHANKEIFETLGIREHFNISKITKLKHYTDSIRSRGVTGSFNTEHTERLHIDFAKSSYRASNHKDYIPEMIKWLERQEAVRKFASYLEWAVPGYEAEFTALESATSDLSLNSPEANSTSDDTDDIDTLDVDDIQSHRLSKKPAFRNIPITQLSQDYHAPDLLFRVNDFFRDNSIPLLRELTSTSPLDVYKLASLTLPAIPEISSTPVLDKFRAVKGEHRKETPNGLKPAKAPCFDTVLIHIGEGPVDSITTLRAARLRLIFRVPDTHDSTSTPLAYVEWYTPFTRFSTDLGMFEISPSTRHHRRHSQVVKLSHVIRSCHLIPVFGAKQVRATWVSEYVLDQASNFYLNPYLRHHDFFLLRYRPDLEHFRKQEQLRRARIRKLGRAGRFTDNI